jgi:drug/metabolite transporter (DMT)-like permease
MSLFGLSLVLLAALQHASWNFLAKRVQGGLPFTWFCDVCGVLLWAPAIAVFVIVTKPAFAFESLGVILISVLLQTAYLWCLQNGYRVGDFSQVYPIARGVGAGGAVLGAVILLGERLTLLGGLGALALLSGMLIITTGGKHQRIVRNSLPGIGFGIATGMCTAGYTLWDKTAVASFGIAPMLLFYGVLAGRMTLLTPLAVRSWPTVQRHWQQHRYYGMGIALLMFGSYVLVLTAMTFTAASAVAPAREVSILFGTLMGQQLLAERYAARRLFGASLIVGGIIAIVLGAAPQ